MRLRRPALLLAVAWAAAAAPAALAHDLRGARAPLAALPALPAPSTSADAPDLRIELPAVPYSGQVAPVYVDAYEQPGRLLYRFDSVIRNTGGVLDVFGDAGSVRQKVWPGGEPASAPVPDAPPPEPTEDRTASGASFAYVREPTHEHWHFFSAARYSLLVPGAAARVSEKVGFCLFDSFDTPGGVSSWFAWKDGARTWCRFSEPASTFVRMGLSRGAADRYSAQREFQYVDVTGLAPGPYTLRAQANPDGHVIEADPSDDVHEEERVVPGVVAAGAELATIAGSPGAVEVAARAVAPEIPARRSASCTPKAQIESCYLRITASTPLAHAVQDPPAHGSASFDGARLTYAPVPGFSGSDSLTYVATDARGLRSAPARVAITVAPAAAAAPDTAGAGTPDGDPGARRLLRIGSVRRTGARRLGVRLRCLPVASGACAGTLEARIAGRRAGRARFAVPSGGRRTVALRLRRPVTGRLVRLRATGVRDALGAALDARRTAPAPRRTARPDDRPARG